MEAIELHCRSEVVDLHVDSFIWTRLFGYDLLHRHGQGLLGARRYSQADLPRLIDGGITGATWIITTNPFRCAQGRARALRTNLVRLCAILRQAADRTAIVANASEYWAARRAGKQAAFLGIQGANALDPKGTILDDYGSLLLLVTLVHLTDSEVGSTSSPVSWRKDRLTTQGKDWVVELESRRIFPDLAHLSRGAFWDAVGVHNPTLPLLVSHTGVTGAHSHWRNLDDEQLRAVAKSGGVVGIFYATGFLGDGRSRRHVDTVTRHISHVIRTVGEDHVSLGSDWDGNIVTPRDMPTCLELPRLTQSLLDQGWSPECIQKVLGGNVLRVLAQLRG